MYQCLANLHIQSKLDTFDALPKLPLSELSMKKSELVVAVAEGADISKAAAARAVDAVFETITAALAKGDTVGLVGFGTFGVKERAARTGRNPKTGEEIQIAAAKVPTFKAGKVLKDSVAG